MAEVVASRLRKQIIDGDLLEGDSLPSEAVEQFGVSRPTLREAYRVLESEALITVRRGAHGGARVHVPDSDVVARYAALVLGYRTVTLRDVYAARAVLEPGCAAMAAQRRPTANLDQLWAAMADAGRCAGDSIRFIEQETSFHKLLVSASGKPDHASPARNASADNGHVEYHPRAARCRISREYPREQESHPRPPARH
jgi:GntR family transcriptional regulator, transcriptional repressor for pyruvate dehydrogenase complex